MLLSEELSANSFGIMTGVLIVDLGGFVARQYDAL